MRFLVDTNILVYAVNRDAEEHRAAAAKVEEWLGGSVPWGLTWGIVYEFFASRSQPAGRWSFSIRSSART